MTDTSPTRFQSFSAATSPDQGPPRIMALRAAMAAEKVDAFVIPRADAHQGEYVAPSDERLAWLTGFTGSAGFAVVTRDKAAVFADGRYTLQARAQCADDIEIMHWPATSMADWLKAALPEGAIVALDPWLHTLGEISAVERDLSGTGIHLQDSANLVDKVWTDRPDRPAGPVTAFPKEIAGKGDETKRAEIADILRKKGQSATVLTLPDSICWLLNIRGSDIPRTPITQAFAILHENGRLDLFSDPEKFAGLGPDPAIAVHPWTAFEPRLAELTGPLRVDKGSAPLAVTRILTAAGVDITYAEDPCALPKACKTPAEIAATRQAHLRDGAAMARFLHWFDAHAITGITEIDCVRALEGFRTETGCLKDISFETISGAGPNGAIVHYRVTADSNRQLNPGELFLIDSGGQYEDGTTDITRTLPVGAAGAAEREAFTQVLRGMIAIHRARFPKGVSGRDLDALARAALWAAGRDYDHGTGHGVGVYLGVHEGPQRLSRTSLVPLQPGMILSNEPGYYRAGAFGIRIENLVVVQDAPPCPGGDDRQMLSFETLTYAPIDRRLIDTGQLSPLEIKWIDTYHEDVARRIGPLVDGDVAQWLGKATAPL